MKPNETAPVARKITAVLTAKDGQAEALSAFLSELAIESRAEPGNLAWNVWSSVDAPGVFVLDELYVDQAAVVAHRATAHFERYLARIADLAARQAIVSKPVDVA